ncbi:hypothetical protein [Xanthomonas graminis]|nr:hypothetical protein [Xanthomonas translucens]UKE78036.1 hypothetical protein KM317_01915 [Xanthomonas translucens pv. arrhenatheri]
MTTRDRRVTIPLFIFEVRMAARGSARGSRSIYRKPQEFENAPEEGRWVGGLKPYREIEWHKLASVGPCPLDYLRANRIPLYVGVDGGSDVAYASYMAHGFPVIGFLPRLHYLRVSNDDLGRLQLSGGPADRRRFHGGGLIYVPSFEGRPQGYRYLTFKECHVVSQAAVESQRAHLELIPFHERLPDTQRRWQKFAVGKLIESRNLYLEKADHDALLEQDKAPILDFPNKYNPDALAVRKMYQLAYEMNVAGLDEKDVWNQLRVAD